MLNHKLYYIIGFLTTITTIQSQTIYYVNNKVSCVNNSCATNHGKSIDKAFPTIQKGIDVLKAGDKLYILGGVYYEHLDLNGTGQTAVNGTAKSPITIETYPPDFPNNPAIIDGSHISTRDNDESTPPILTSYSSFDATNILFRIYGNHITIQNLELRNSMAVSIYVSSVDSGEYDTLPNPNAGGENITINNVHIHNSYGTGIYLFCAKNAVITNCIIHDIYDYGVGGKGGGGNADGIGCNAYADNKTPIHLYSNHLIKNNIIYNCSDDGIDTWNTQKNTIHSNKVGHIGYANSSNGITVDSDYIPAGNGGAYKLGPGGNNLVYNNIAYDFRKEGFYSNLGSGNRLYNNTAYGTTGTGFRIQSVKNTEVKNNISTTENSIASNPSNIVANNNWNLEIVMPTFKSTNPKDADFLHLDKNSSARDRGIIIPESKTTYSGKSPDIGAFEYMPSFFKKIANWFK